MTKALKPYLGITLATLFLVQAMVLPFLVQNEPAIIRENVPYQIGNFVNHDEKSPIIFESDRITVTVSKSLTEGGDFISVSFADYFLYLHHYLRTAYQLCQEVDLVFGIRELKFPTHFFW